ncbi:MAG TPA: glycosyltransferase [Opitutus sp.]|nr:glycosyltransferase [Opitutus sp.]
MNRSALISVVLPVYNAERYLAGAMESILAQSFTRFELLAIDDGSRDGSLAILQRFARRDRRVHIVSRPNTGIVGALNDGLAAASAPLIARMDADDVALPDRFARQFNYMEENRNCVALGTAVDFLDESGHRVMSCPRPLDHASIESGLLKGDGGMIIHPSVMLRRDAVLSIGGYRRQAEYVEDLDLYLRLALVGRLANLPETLLCYRIHTTSINFTKNAGRYQTKLGVMAEAFRARGLPFSERDIPDRSAAWADPVRRYREWAATALQFGSRRVAVRHGVAACRLDPWNWQSWRSLRYALTAPIPAKAKNLAPVSRSIS